MSNTRKRRRPQAAGAGNGGSLRARLSARQRPSFPYPLLVDDATEAQQRVQDARQRHRQASLRYDEEAHASARQRLDADPDDADIRKQVEKWDKAAAALADATEQLEGAQAELEGCYATVRLRAMRPEAYEQLVAAHPPTEQQLADTNPPVWNDATFIPALLTACAEGDMTADDWAALLTGDDEGHGLSRAEATELRLTVIALNERARFADPAALPFASTGTRS